MEIESSNDKNNLDNNLKKRDITSPKGESELKRFKSHEVYLVTKKNPKKNTKNENSSKDHKKIIINISQPDNMKPRIKKSFNNNSNIKKSKNKLLNNNEFIFEEGKQLIKTQKTTINKSKTKGIMSSNNKKEKQKLTISNYVNNAKKNINNSSKLLNEESIQEIDSEDNNVNIAKINQKTTIAKSSKINNTYYNINSNNCCNKAKNININNKNNYTNNINMNLTNNYFIENNDKNKIIKKINFDELNNSINKKNNLIMNNTLDKDNEKNREFLLIAKKGDKEKMLELLSTNQININFQMETGWNALHFACDEGNLKIVDILLQSNADLNLKTNEKKTALHIACLRGFFDISKLLIEHGANINIRDNEKNLPIHICASQGHDELLTFILEKNSSGIKVKNVFGKTPLDLANKESTKEIIKKFLNLKKKNTVRVTGKDKNNISPKITSGINYNYNHLNNNKNQFSRIKIHKTNKNQMKSLMMPISPNHLNKNLNIPIQHSLNNTNNTSNDFHDALKTNNSKKFYLNKSNINTNSTQEINSNENTSNNTINTYNTYNILNNTHPKNNNNNNENNKSSTKINQNNAVKKPSSNVNPEKRPSKVKIDLSSVKNINNNSINNSSNNNSNNNTNRNNNNNFKTLSNNSKYLNYSSNKRKVIFNIHISCSNNNNSNNNTNKSNSPSKDSFMRYNTSSNMTSSSKKIYTSSNNNSKINEFPAGTDIFFAKEKDKVRGKIINIPKKVNNKKENRSQSKKKNVSSVWKTVSQNERMDPKFSPNIKCMGKPKKKMTLFKKEDSKILNNLSSKRTVSVPRFLDTEYILEKPSNKKGFKREESAKNKFKVPKKNNNNINNSNNNVNNKNKGRVINTNVKNMKKQNSNRNNNKCNVIGLKNRQIYTEEDANLIDDLEEETIIEINKDKDKDKLLNKTKSKEIKTSNNSLNTNGNNYNNNVNLKKAQTMESDDEFDDIEELEDSIDDSEDSDTNKEEKVGPSDFICLALLGQGSFGEVYLVKKKDSDDFYAMKVLDKCRIAKQNIFKYVLTERNVLSVMHNPFIVKLNYAFQTSEKLFLLLDYCPGGDLSKQLQIQTRFSEEKAKFYICEIILALGELHKNNIIFRDLKPDNVVIDKEGHALLTDFGLSREGVVGKEIAKSFCGSIAYLAPEMLNRCGHGKAVDWYLLGVLFYELLVGVPPYFTANQEQIFRNIQKAELYIPPFVSEKAQNLIKSLLKRNPNERLGSKRDIEEIKEHEYFSDVDWQKVYERKYKPPQIYLKSNHLQYFRQPVQFRENEEDDLFVKDSNVNYNKYNQDFLNTMNNYEGWSFVQKSKGNKE